MEAIARLIELVCHKSTHKLMVKGNIKWKFLDQDEIEPKLIIVMLMVLMYEWIKETKIFGLVRINLGGKIIEKQRGIPLEECKPTKIGILDLDKQNQGG